jgi:hypothetical protein
MFEPLHDDELDELNRVVTSSVSTTMENPSVRKVLMAGMAAQIYAGMYSMVRFADDMARAESAVKAAHNILQVIDEQF